MKRLLNVVTTSLLMLFGLFIVFPAMLVIGMFQKPQSNNPV
jgi:hypothetical protein